MSATIERPATDWRGWKITDEQAQQIHNGNADARNRFYFDNFPRLRKMAYNYASKNPRCKGLAEDMIQGLYVDLSVFESAYHYPVIDGAGLSRWVYRSFVFARFGGLAYLTENNPKLLAGGGLALYAPDLLSLDGSCGKGGKRHQDEDNARTLADIIPAPDLSIDSDRMDECKAIIADILAPREREYLGHYIEGYAPAEIGARMGCKGDSYGVYGTRARKKLAARFVDILDRLDALGVNVDEYRDKTPYNPQTERAYKLTPEQRARAAETMRRYRARKKAQTPVSVG